MKMYPSVLNTHSNHDNMHVYIYLYPLVEFLHALIALQLLLDAAVLLLAEGDVSFSRVLLKPALAVWALDIVWVRLGELRRRESGTCMVVSTARGR